MGRLARLAEVAVRSVPARMIGIVPAGASLAGTALPTRCAMQNRFVWTRGPIFVNIELGCSSRRSGGSGNQSSVGRDLLQLRARVAAHGKQRQAIHFFEFAHHGENSLHGQRIRLDEVCLHQRKIFAMDCPCRVPVVVQSGARHLRHFAGNFVGRNRDDSNSTERDHRQSEASSPENTRKRSGTEFSTSAICDMFPLAAFTPAILATSLNLAMVTGSRLAEVRPGTL